MPFLGFSFFKDSWIPGLPISHSSIPLLNVAVIWHFLGLSTNLRGLSLKQKDIVSFLIFIISFVQDDIKAKESVMKDLLPYPRGIVTDFILMKKIY